jgi:inhibitor of KinA sporulation pathway (predicted exonuclease)
LLNVPILIIDLEATCSDDEKIPSEQMETIEIGACWVQQDGVVLDRFQSFVRPVRNPRLTAFCISLTGIHQADVDNAPMFPVAAASLHQFVEQYRAPASVWMSWGAYDQKQITRDSALHDVTEPIGLPHQNAKRLFAKAQRIGKEVGMAKACQLTRLTLKGVHHRALDDALNIARLMPWVFGERTLGQKP